GCSLSLASARRRSALAAVDLAAHEGDGALIDRSGVPRLDGRKIGLAGLISRAGAPAMRPQKVRRRGERVGSDVEIAGAIGQNVLGHELGLTDLAVHGAA